MKMIIRIADLISTDIRSRSNIDKIKDEMKKYPEQDIILDFCGVTFISRSFADELYSMVYNNEAKIELINLSDTVSSMIEAVKSGRNTKRIHPVDNTEIKEFDDIKSLSLFLSTM